MLLHDIFQNKRKKLDNLKQLRKAKEIEEKINCPGCGKKLQVVSIREHYYTCPECNFYFKMSPKERIRLIADAKSFRELWKDLETTDPLMFPEYKEKVLENQKKTGLKDACVTGVIKICGKPVAVGVLDGRFLMGSMGTVVGEKITRLAEYAEGKKLPLLIFSASGGARMQEGLFSLMQMAKTAAAIERFKKQGGLFISVFTNPTTGGVSASFASLGDICLSEPKALICFAGPRVIEQTIGQKLPEGFQRAEFLIEHGMLDRIVERKDLRELLDTILSLHQGRGHYGRAEKN